MTAATSRVERNVRRRRRCAALLAGGTTSTVAQGLPPSTVAQGESSTTTAVATTSTTAHDDHDHLDCATTVAGLATYRDDCYDPRVCPPPHLHQGNDIFAAFDTPVRAPVDGVVTFSGGSPTPTPKPGPPAWLRPSGASTRTPRSGRRPPGRGGRRCCGHRR